MTLRLFLPLLASAVFASTSLPAAPPQTAAKPAGVVALVGGTLIDGFGSTTRPLVYNGVDYLGLHRDAAIEAAYGQVGIRRGLLNVGVVESLAEAVSPFNQRGNDDGDPFTLDPTGFNFAGSAAIWDRVIDPAAYGGHREVDLAMLSLFGLPHLHRVLEAYDEEHPLADGWRDRLGVHQLFPLLVHACLFGGGYGARAADTARSFA